MESQVFDLILKDNHWYDFNQIALNYPPLYKYLLIFNYKTTIDFLNPTALIELTTGLIKYLFNLKWFTLPNHLCPRIPNRINYLTWLHESFESQIKNVIDIGTGAGLIYPLIGVKLYNWNFIATEIDQESVKNGRKLIQANNLQNKIDIRQSNGELLEGIIDKNCDYSLLICNPPFFSQQQNTLSKMSATQHHTEGGEYQFFFNIYNESLDYHNIKYFTLQIGRETSFWEIKKFLDEEKKSEIISKSYYGLLIQGNIKRFIVGWKVCNQSQYS